MRLAELFVWVSYLQLRRSRVSIVAPKLVTTNTAITADR